MKRILFSALVLVISLASIVGLFTTPVHAMTGSGTAEDPYVIYNVTDLQNVSNNLTAYYVLGNNINASVTSTWNDGRGFKPIGLWVNWGAVVPPSPYVGSGGVYWKQTPFTGHFDGKGYTVSNLFMHWTRYEAPTATFPDYFEVGLFSMVSDGGVVQNVNLSGMTVEGWKDVGGLVGYAYSKAGTVLISNCSSSGAVESESTSVGGLVGITSGYASSTMLFVGCSSSATVTGNTNAAGGLVGDSYTVDFISCYATGPVSAVSFYAGGLVGFSYLGTVNGCYATGDVSSLDFGAGGLIGRLQGSTISECYATGDVSVANNYVGGLVGYTVGVSTISKSYATGDASGGSWGSGGLVGVDSGGTSITDCYARGAASGGNAVGGLLGDQGGSVTNCYSTGLVVGTGGEVGGLIGNGYGVTTNSFWDIQTSGWATSNGGTGKTTAQMKTKSTFTNAGWDFTTIWGISPSLNNGYPVLRALAGSSNPGEGNGSNGMIPPPTYLLAIPVSSTEISLSWVKAVGATFQTGIYYKVGSYPTTGADGTQIYLGAGQSYTHSGLAPGTTYFYRAWTYDTSISLWSGDYDQDYAITLIGSVGMDAPPMPSEWFQTPQCTAYEQLPIWIGMESFASAYEVPPNTFCVMFTLLWITCAGIGTFVITKNGLLPSIVLAVLIVVTSIAGLLPMWMLAVGIALGGLMIFVWQRT